MSTQNTSTPTHEPPSPRARDALDAPHARDAAVPKLHDNGRMADIPLSPDAKITVERRGQIVLIGVNRPQAYNRFDPDAFFGLATAYHDFDNDPSLRAAVLFGHGQNFSRGIDVDAFAPLAKTGKPFAVKDGMLDPFARTRKLSKPLIAVVHGDTWNMAHELHLVADIRVASAEVRFGQDENTHGRFPGGGSTIRFPREAGWGNAMRYMLTGDHWGAQEAYRMGLIQQIAPTPAQALDAGIGLARKIAACGPLGIKTTLTSAHLAIDQSPAAAFARLDEQFGALFRTEDFTEGRNAEAEGRAPVYHGR
ncbi:MAG TPA: enoyl-CoA hydratase-related protein [Streptosporangiaceae bacterium]|nr:enoyl-CoA hydratase-related protein [Streptosporangiaceae bacterium]